MATGQTKNIKFNIKYKFQYKKNKNKLFCTIIYLNILNLNIFIIENNIFIKNNIILKL